MRVIALRGFRVAGESIAGGTEIELDDAIAAEVIYSGKAKKIEAAPARPKRRKRPARSTDES